MYKGYMPDDVTEYLVKHCKIINDAREKLREQLLILEPELTREHLEAKMTMEPAFSKSKDVWYAPLFSWIQNSRKRYFIIAFPRHGEAEVDTDNPDGVKEVTDEMERAMQ
jgi:hypothetical protein